MTDLKDETKKSFWYLKRRVLLEFDREWTCRKTDLIHFIARRLNLKNYLELCTSTAGLRYSDIMRWRFRTSRRLMYNCPDNFDDGLPIDFKVSNFDIDPAVSKIKKSADRVDICLVDAFHTYDCTIRDLNSAYDLLADGGILVVHDCLPPDESGASPTFKQGDWCGVSYKAYLDFVLARNDFDYCTVNVDCGCGIIVKKRTMNFLPDASTSVRKSKLASDWFSIHNDDDKTVFRFFLENHEQLLRLISAKTFVHGLGRDHVRPSPIWVSLPRALWKTSRRAATAISRT